MDEREGKSDHGNRENREAGGKVGLVKKQAGRKEGLGRKPTRRENLMTVEEG